MSYIVKNTTGIINTRLTDAGRRKLSQGNFHGRKARRNLAIEANLRGLEDETDPLGNPTDR